MKQRKISLFIVISFVISVLTGCSQKCSHPSVITNPRVEPTCVSHGVTESAYCEKCQAVLIEPQIIEPLGHNVVIDAAISATCTKDGLTSGAHCSRCQEVIFPQTVIGHVGHKVVVDHAIEPTCTSHGLSEGTRCETCGEILIKQEIIEPLGHNIVIDEAITTSCLEDGITSGAHCARCKEVLIPQTIIPHLGHKVAIDLGIEPTCLNHGLTEGMHCETCHEVFKKQEVIEPLGHDVVIDDKIEATCTEDGLTSGMHCARCNEVLVAQNIIPHPGHKVVVDPAKEATCTTSGLTEGSHCETCGEVLVKQEVIEPLGHDIVIDDGYNATCTEDGLTNGAHCARCHEIIISQSVIPHPGHMVIKDKAVKPTCTEHGLTAGMHCGVCGEILVPQEILEPLGHRVVIDPRVEPTATESGLTEGAHCARCGEIFVAQQPIDPLGYQVSFVVNNDDYGYLEGEVIQQLSPNEQSVAVTAIPYLGYRFKCWSNGSIDNPLVTTVNDNTIIVANFEIDDLELPVMEINTIDKTPITSKEEYVGCDVSVFNTDYQYEFANKTGKIKGRGNSTWNMPKKPYKLKFDKKVDLFGHGSAKTWTLIANYCDPSLARNYFAYEMGALLESNYCTTTEFIDLYVNHEYMGVYLVCEQNEVGKTRVDIDESYDDVNTGYLLELDGRAVDEGIEDRDYFYFQGQTYAIKSPDTEEEGFNEDFVNYIKNYLSLAFSAIRNKDINLINQYIDIDSFAKSYLVYETMKAIDVGSYSFYLSKDKDGKLTSGPIWDFDISAGNYDYGIDNPDSSYSTLWAATTNIWYRYLLEVDEFRQLVKDYLDDYHDDISSMIDNSINYLKNRSYSFNRNFVKWDILGTYVWPNSPEIVAINSWTGQVDYLANWLHQSLNYIYSYYQI